MRVGPSVFADPYSGVSGAAEASRKPAVEGLSEAAGQLLPAVVDGWSEAASDLSKLLAQQSPEVARLTLSNAAGTLETVTKRVERRGVARENVSALQQAMKTLDGALSASVLGHATELEATGLQMAMRALQDALLPHLKDPKAKVARELSDKLGAALVKPAGSEVEELVYDPGDQGLFEKPPVSTDLPLQIFHETPIETGDRAELVKMAKQRPLQIVDIDGERPVHLWRGPRGEVCCDDPAWVKSMGGKLSFVVQGGYEQLDGMLDGALQHGLQEVGLQLETTGELSSLDASLVALDRIQRRTPTLKVDIWDEAGIQQMSARPFREGTWRMRLPAVPKEREAEVEGVLGKALNDREIGALTFGGLGFVRGDRGDIVAEIPQGKELRQVFRGIAPVFSRQLANALGLDEGAQGRSLFNPLFSHAVEHLNYSKDPEAEAMRDAASWSAAVTEVGRYAQSSPKRRALVMEAIGHVMRRSETKENDGFGNPFFRGHARSRNAFDLITGIGKPYASDPAIDAFLTQTKSLFDIPVRGAVVGLAKDIHVSDDTSRMHSAKTELDCLGQLVDATGARTSPDVVVAVLPTDRTHGGAKTPTPDFYVRKEIQGRTRELFVDAKARAARGVLERGDTGVAEAAHQVYGHGFGITPDAEGMIMLDIYNASAAQKEKLLDTVQRDVDRATVDRPLWVSAQLRDVGGRKETVVLHPADASQDRLPAVMWRGK